MAARMTLALSVLSVLGLGAFAANDLQNTITVNNGCAGFEWTGLQDDFDYRVKIDSVQAASGCNVTVSKFYAQGACIGSRNNDIGLAGKIKDLACDKAEDNSQNTCNAVFTSAPKDALVPTSSISTGQTYDNGQACYSSDKGYVYVKSTCSTPVTVSATLTADKYSGGVCISTKGWHLNGVAIGLLVTAGVIFLVLAVLCCCCCCRRCR